MSDTKAAEVIDIRARVEKAKSEMSKLEGEAEAAERRKAELAELLRTEGIDPAGDVDAQLEERTKAALEALADVETGIVELRAEVPMPTTGGKMIRP